MMHACGHDGHTAMLLGAAKYSDEQVDFSGALNLIFHPDEESLGGALRMLKEIVEVQAANIVEQRAALTGQRGFRLQCWKRIPHLIC